VDQALRLAIRLAGVAISTFILHTFPATALALPIQERSQRLQMLQIDRVAPFGNPRQEQNVFLDFRRQMEQVRFASGAPG
jgi:hypothetical protein